MPDEIVLIDHAGYGDDEMEYIDEEEVCDKMTSQILNCPDVLQALYDRLCAEFMATRPPPVKRKIKALKKLQMEATNIQAKFFEEVHALECKYHKLYSPLYEKRANIVSGLYEPNDEEANWPSDDKNMNDDIKNRATLEEIDTKENETTADKNIFGIPNFWLTVFKNVAVLKEMVQEHDEPILKHLIDVQVLFLRENPMGFALEFHFSPNEYFSNSFLTKEYEMKCVPEPDNPFNFDGPEIYKCKGFKIDWRKGKNVTLKTVTRKQRYRSKGFVRTITKTVRNDSFFNFFSPPIIPEDPRADIDEDTKAVLTTDFEIGHYIRERIVPRAVLLFTGEGLEDEEYEEEEEEDEDEDLNSPEAKQTNCKQQ